MRKDEARFATRFRKWARDRVGQGAYELKHTRGSDRFRMSELKEHQRDFLKAANGRAGLVYKIPDDGVAHKPFDMFVLKRTPAWVVIAYPAGFAVINIRRICAWGEPSLHWNDAVAMASFRGDYNELT